MAWEVVIGLETHAQLATASKAFSGSSTAFGAAPNTQASAIDLALPGTLPVANRAAIELAIRFGLAVNGRIAPRSVYERKNYFYPDLPKGYQISQYAIPIVSGGTVKFTVDGQDKELRLTRAHLEEDAGKSLHQPYIDPGCMEQTFTEDHSYADVSRIDLNRAGVPLLEIVTEPELRGAQEAVAYARALHALVRWIGICDGNMQEGSFRCDANVSVRKSGDTRLGTRCEIKNLNSFRFMEEAIEFEAKRQIAILEDGGKIEQETRLYDPDERETRPMRSKEDAQDYRYFPDPDLLPLVVTEATIAQIRQDLPELPSARSERYVAELKLSRYDAGLMTASRGISEYFEETFRLTPGATKNAVDTGIAKLCCNWISGALAAALNDAGLDIEKSRIPPAALAGLLGRITDLTVSSKAAKEVFDAMWAGEGNADQVIQKRGLRQVSDTGEIEKLVDAAIAAGAKQVADYRAGKEKALQSLVGQVMKASQGRANPAQVNEILRRKLGG